MFHHHHHHQEKVVQTAKKVNEMRNSLTKHVELQKNILNNRNISSLSNSETKKCIKLKKKITNDEIKLEKYQIQLHKQIHGSKSYFYC
nr:hypothetical protein [Microctonus hyperodae filamentous virus]